VQNYTALKLLSNSVGEAGFEGAQLVEITEITVDSGTEDPTRVDVSAREPVAIGPSENDPTSSHDALKLAIKLAVDAGEYERAVALLEVAKRTTKPGASVVSIVELAKR
jgi:hypothetical protein